MELNTTLKPIKDFKFYKRNLPHYELRGSIYFVTFKTAEEFTLSEPAKDITLDSVKFHAGKKYRLHSCVIMETHVHVILEPSLVEQASLPASKELKEGDLTYYSLAQILHSIKSYSANKIQKLLNKKGNIWLNENYDRLIRDDKEYEDKMNYIINNPVKVGLVEKPEDYRWLFVEGREN